MVLQHRWRPCFHTYIKSLHKVVTSVSCHRQTVLLAIFTVHLYSYFSLNKTCKTYKTCSDYRGNLYIAFHYVVNVFHLFLCDYLSTHQSTFKYQCTSISMCVPLPERLQMSMSKTKTERYCEAPARLELMLSHVKLC